MASVYIDSVMCLDEQDPQSGDLNDEIFYELEWVTFKHDIDRDFDAGEIHYPSLLVGEASASDPLFFALWEDDPGSGDEVDENFYHVEQTLGGDAGLIESYDSSEGRPTGGIYFDGTPGLYSYEFSGYGGTYAVDFTVF